MFACEGADMEQGGERLESIERLIVSPVAGVFSRRPDLPELVTVGAALGYVQVGTEQVPVLSPFAGRLIAIDAVDGERLVPYQRVGWLRAA